MSTFFLGTKRILTSTSLAAKTLIDEDSDDDDEGETTTLYQLSRASELVVNDEPAGEPSLVSGAAILSPSSQFSAAAFRVFQTEVLACPQEDALEVLAEALGAHRISSLVSEHYRTAGEPDEGAKRAGELRRSAFYSSLAPFAMTLTAFLSSRCRTHVSLPLGAQAAVRQRRTQTRSRVDTVKPEGARGPLDRARPNSQNFAGSQKALGRGVGVRTAQQDGRCRPLHFAIARCRFLRGRPVDLQDGPEQTEAE